MPRTGNVEQDGIELHSFCHQGKVNSGINPKVADVKIPKANPFKLFIVLRILFDKTDAKVVETDICTKICARCLLYGIGI